MLTGFVCLILAGCAGRTAQETYTTQLVSEHAGLRQETAEPEMPGAGERMTGEGVGLASAGVEDMASGGLESSAGAGRSAGSEASGGAEVTDRTGAPDETEHAGGTEMVCVFVCGAVERPGVYELPQGARIYEALALAGGFAAGADTDWLNQAEPVFDGQKLYVFTEEETKELERVSSAAACGGTGSTGGMGSTTVGKGGPGVEEAAAASGEPRTGSLAPGTGGTGLVNLNTATREELMTLTGIGEAKADAILAYRAEHGGFSSIEELQKISGIKSAVFSKIKDQITV